VDQKKIAPKTTKRKATKAAEPKGTDAMSREDILRWQIAHLKHPHRARNLHILLGSHADQILGIVHRGGTVTLEQGGQIIVLRAGEVEEAGRILAGAHERGSESRGSRPR
jgi:hypothetical protein